MNNKKGLIWDIQKFNIHDGQGIRTLIFFKGCPLRCLWCSNPEGQETEPELQLFVNKCMECGLCKEVCPLNAIKYNMDNIPMINRDKCNLCGECVETCPGSALTIVGEQMTVEEVLREVRKDAAFYWRSGGGVTLTGGEPCLQAEFASSLLKALQEITINTAIETCGYIEWSQLKKVIPFTDTFLYDIKNMDNELHKEQTGVANKLILNNARKLAQSSETELIFRTPIIPGKNDSRQNLISTARFASDLNVKRWDLMAYHRLGEGKYGELGKQYKLKGLKPPGDERMEAIVNLVKDIFPRVEIENK